MGKYNYLQVNCGCTIYSVTAYAEKSHFAGQCEAGCGQIPVVKTYDEADDPEYFIGVAEGELEMYNRHSRVDQPRREYEQRIQGVEDPAEAVPDARPVHPVPSP